MAALEVSAPDSLAVATPLATMQGTAWTVHTMSQRRHLAKALWKKLSMFITLDNNCIIAIENGEEPNATVLRLLASKCHQGEHTLVVYSYLPLENRPFKVGQRAIADFPARLEALGIGPIETLRPAMNLPLVQLVNSLLFPHIPHDFFDYLAAECAKSDISLEALEALEEANHDHLFLRFPATPAEASIPLPDTLTPEDKQNLRVFWDKRHRKWNNKKSDVLALCAHITWAPDGIFVTADIDDLVSKRMKLREIVPTLRIMTPMEAVDVVC
jgi:hypothetical protein